MDMIGDMGVRVREEEVVDVVRMGEKEELGLASQLLLSLKVNMINGLCYGTNQICGK